MKQTMWAHLSCFSIKSVSLIYNRKIIMEFTIFFYLFFLGFGTNLSYTSAWYMDIRQRAGQHDDASCVMLLRSYSSLCQNNFQKQYRCNQNNFFICLSSERDVTTWANIVNDQAFHPGNQHSSLKFCFYFTLRKKPPKIPQQNKTSNQTKKTPIHNSQLNKTNKQTNTFFSSSIPDGVLCQVVLGLGRHGLVWSVPAHGRVCGTIWP